MERIKRIQGDSIHIVKVGGDAIAHISETNPIVYVRGGYDHYHGDMDITPTATRQTLATADLVVDGNIIIEPIPSNYGLITWNGSTLTVS